MTRGTMHRHQRSAWGPPCPIGGEDHGPLLYDQSGSWGGRYYCPHNDHVGRAPGHPDGELPATRSFFEPKEVMP